MEREREREEKKRAKNEYEQAKDRGVPISTVKLLKPN